MAKVGEIKVEISGDSADLQKAVANAKQELGDLEGELQGMGDEGTSASDGLLDLDGAAGSLTDSLDGLGGIAGGAAAAGIGTAAAGAAAAAAAFYKTAQAAAELTSEVARSQKKLSSYSRALGVSREQLKAFAEMGAQMGADIDDSVDILAEANKELQEMQKGGGRLAKTLEGTAANMEKLKAAKGPIDLIKRLRGELDKLNPTMKRAALQAVMGEEGFRQFGGAMMEGGAQMDKYRKKLSDYGVLLDKTANQRLQRASDAQHNFNMAIEGLKNQIAAGFADDFATVTEELNKWVEATTGLLRLMSSMAGEKPVMQGMIDAMTPEIMKDAREQLIRYNKQQAKAQRNWKEAKGFVEDMWTGAQKAAREWKQFGSTFRKVIENQITGDDEKLFQQLEPNDQIELRRRQLADAKKAQRKNPSKANKRAVIQARKRLEIQKTRVAFQKDEITRGQKQLQIENARQSASEKLKNLQKQRAKAAQKEADALDKAKNAMQKALKAGRKASDDAIPDNVPTDEEMQAQRRRTAAAGTEDRVDDLRARKAEVEADLQKKINNLKDQYVESEERARLIRQARLEAAEKHAKLESRINDILKDREVDKSKPGFQGMEIGTGSEFTPFKEDPNEDSGRPIRGGGQFGQFAEMMRKSGKQMKSYNEEIEGLETALKDVEGSFTKASVKGEIMAKKQAKAASAAGSAAQGLSMLGGIISGPAAQFASNITTLGRSQSQMDAARAERNRPGMTAAEKRQNTMKDTGTILKGAGAGAQMGAAFGPVGAIVGGGVGAIAGAIGVGAQKKKRKARERRKRERRRFQAGQTSIKAQIVDAPPAQKESLKKQKKMNKINRQIEKGQISHAQGEAQKRLLREQLEEQRENRKHQTTQISMNNDILKAQLHNNDYQAAQLQYQKTLDDIAHRVEQGAISQERAAKLRERANLQRRMQLKQLRKGSPFAEENIRKFGQIIGKEAGRELGRQMARGRTGITMADPTEVSAQAEAGEEGVRELQEDLDRENRHNV
jgi:hypothetical protein